MHDCLLIWTILDQYRSHTSLSEGTVVPYLIYLDQLSLVYNYYHSLIINRSVYNTAFAFQGHEGWVEDVQISRDMKWLLSCSKVCQSNT